MNGMDSSSFLIDDLSNLIIKIKNDDTAAFKEFFFLMQPGIYKFLLRYTAEPESAKDLVQETFINFWQHRAQLESKFPPKSYLYKIARNLAINYVSRNHPDTCAKFQKPDIISSLLNPEEEYEKHFLMNEFQNAVNELPERCRATFILCKYEGFEYSEIADILDVSLQTVKNQMNKALSILKKLLSAHLK
ncbi:MAG: RNA polymerase sigma-70 factor [Ignavibacteriaceae bacterium]|nr:RNA polymerase sigma-70 factor [Ignavibacteriaceae bacterium]